MPRPITCTTDYVTSQGDPEPYLRRIAAAGIAHLHWCHEWNTDALYEPPEVSRLEGLLRELKLSVHDIHGSAGKDQFWGSTNEEARRAGVALVLNRIELAHRWQCPVVIMHAPSMTRTEYQSMDLPAYWARFYKTLDALEPACRRLNIRIALENMGVDNFDLLEHVFADYDPAFIGLCYDPGHGNLAKNGLDRVDGVRGRLIALHLNDNDGSADQHKPIFAGTVDWPRLAGIIARSGYERECLGTEVVIKNSGISDEMAFLRHVAESGARFATMVEAEKTSRDVRAEV